jgi:hypothetical protein
MDDETEQRGTAIFIPDYPGPELTWLIIAFSLSLYVRPGVSVSRFWFGYTPCYFFIKLSLLRLIG